jgi:cbb3-type cytochrome oxidase subunit 3
MKRAIDAIGKAAIVAAFVAVVEFCFWRRRRMSPVEESAIPAPPKLRVRRGIDPRSAA